jgi:mRNA-degrading endonuclease toxin of MazEF toxin-antitoxin module
MLVLPLTKKQKNDPFHFKIKMSDGDVWAKLTQIRVISSKRLLRKLDTINEDSFFRLKEVLVNSI